MKPFQPLLHPRRSDRFWAIHRLKFRVDCPGFQPFEFEETNHHSLFHINPKRISMHLKFDARLTRQMTKGSFNMNMKDGYLLHMLVVSEMKAPAGSRYRGGYELVDPRYNLREDRS
jgi:hypothetical protein